MADIDNLLTVLHIATVLLGDPIEMGAAAAVVFSPQQQTRQQPLLTAAGKSWIGHTEAAAGAMGIIHALLGLGNRSAQAIMNLTAVNPYLESALKPQAGLAAAWSLPRQAGSLSCSAGSSLSGKLGSSSVLATGISSFAFQVGTRCWVTHCLWLCSLCSCCSISCVRLAVGVRASLNRTS
jgi:acyl transferase domain-containing protein